MLGGDAISKSIIDDAFLKIHDERTYLEPSNRTCQEHPAHEHVSGRRVLPPLLLMEENWENERSWSFYKRKWDMTPFELGIAKFLVVEISAWRSVSDANLDGTNFDRPNGIAATRSCAPKECGPVPRHYLEMQGERKSSEKIKGGAEES